MTKESATCKDSMFPSYSRVLARQTRRCSRIHIPFSQFSVHSSLSLPIDASRGVYVSESTNPLFNLVLEDWLFKHAPRTQPLLLIYRNDPCVVIGRNQNPWKETNLKTLRDRNIPWFRRRSGGGTVYHDLGNTNFSVHVSRKRLDKWAISEMVCKAVKSFGIDAYVNDRTDIFVGDSKMTIFEYVSGSAYKIVNDRAYHHGTMLISSQLDAITGLLRNDKLTMMSKASVTHETFTRAVIQEFNRAYTDTQLTPLSVKEADLINDPFFEAEMPALIDWTWKFGQTPEFTYKIDHVFPWGKINVVVVSKKGLIVSCTVDKTEVLSDPGTLPFHLMRLSADLRGKVYGSLDHQLDYQCEDVRVRDVIQWLSESMDR